MQLFVWALFGSIAGFIAHIADTHPAKGGLAATMLVGVLGAVGGGIVANIIFGDYFLTFDLTSFTLALSVTILGLLIHRTLFTHPESKI